MDTTSVAYVLCRIEDDASLTLISPGVWGASGATGYRRSLRPRWPILRFKEDEQSTMMKKLCQRSYLI
jgi:hypothetical protein